MLFLSAYVFPMTFTSVDMLRGTMLKLAMLLLLVAILAFGSFFLAALATFLLLEQKDEHTLHTIAVTPVGAAGYLKFKMTYIYVMSVVGNIVLLGTKLLVGQHGPRHALFDNINIGISFPCFSERALAQCLATGPLLRIRWRALRLLRAQGCWPWFQL